MDKLIAIKIKYDNGTYSDEIPVSVLSENVEWDSTHTLVDVLGSIDVDVTGTIQDQISRLFNEKVSNSDMQSYISSSMPTYITNWLNTNVNPVGSAVIVDKALIIDGAAADSKTTGDNLSILKRLKSDNIGSYNLFNKNTVTKGKIITKAGALVDNYSEFCTSDFIPVVPNMIIYWKYLSNKNFAFFDIFGKLISNSNTPDLTYPLVVPENVYYIRVVLQVINLSRCSFSTINVFDEYQTLNEYIHNNFNDFDNKIKYNLTWIDNYFIYKKNGNVVSNSNYKCTDYILFSSDGSQLTIYYKLFLSENTGIAYYDKNKIFIDAWSPSSSSNIEVSGEINPPQEAVYVRFSCFKSYDGKLYLKNTEIKNVLTNNSITNEKIMNQAVSVQKTNFLNKVGNKLFGVEWFENTCINASGVPTSFNGFYATNKVILNPNTTYYWGDIYGGYCAFYDENDNVLEGHGPSQSASALTNPFITPSNTMYARFTAVSFIQTQNGWISENNKKPTASGFLLDEKIYINSSNIINNDKPCDYNGDEVCAFTKCLCIGDSLTEGTMNHLDSGSTKYINIEKYSYPSNFARLTNLEVTNLGIGGASSGEWYNSKKNDDLSGYDIAIIQLGVNDNIRRTSQEKTCEEWFADTSLCGFSNIITKLKNENNNIKIFVANIIPARSYHNTGYLEFSNYLLNWITTTYENDKNIIPVDIMQYGHTYDLDAYNCGHLSAYGYYRLAKDYKNFISWYMTKYPEIFKEIQFIGTNYWYDNPNN